ncbi:hypothetical protein Ancab_028872 [Ancistrocladus abbreviatus]
MEGVLGFYDPKYDVETRIVQSHPYDVQTLKCACKSGGNDLGNSQIFSEQVILTTLRTFFQRIICLGGWKGGVQTVLGGDIRTKEGTTSQIETYESCPLVPTAFPWAFIESLSFCDALKRGHATGTSTIRPEPSEEPDMNFSETEGHHPQHPLSDPIPLDSLNAIQKDCQELVALVQHSPRHPEFPTYPTLEMSINSIPLIGHYPVANPMIPEDLGMGMALTSTPYAHISSILIMMTGLTLPKGMGLKFYQGSHQNILAALDGLQDEHSVTQILETGKNEVDGQIPLDQIINQQEDFGQNKLTSNDTVIKNLGQLDVDNSSLDGPSINSNDIKCKKREEDGKTNPKKKKNQKTSHSTPMP